MTARLLSWWQKIRKPLGIICIIAACIGVVVLVFVEIRLYGTGFVGKTLWDWLGLLASLAIPVVVGFGAAWFTAQQAKVSNAANERQHETELQIATDNQREAALQAYIDKMSELLLEKNLRESVKDDELRKVARVRTPTVLRQLDPTRKASLLFSDNQICRVMRIIKHTASVAGNEPFEGSHAIVAPLLSAHLTQLRSFVLEICPLLWQRTSECILLE